MEKSEVPEKQEQQESTEVPVLPTKLKRTRKISKMADLEQEPVIEQEDQHEDQHDINSLAEIILSNMSVKQNSKLEELERKIKELEERHKTTMLPEPQINKNLTKKKREMNELQKEQLAKGRAKLHNLKQQKKEETLRVKKEIKEKYMGKNNIMNNNVEKEELKKEPLIKREKEELVIHFV